LKEHAAGTGSGWRFLGGCPPASGPEEDVGRNQWAPAECNRFPGPALRKRGRKQ
jgi:hypothetical protein